MSKLKDLQLLVEQDVPYVQNALAPLDKQIKASGIRVMKSGKNVTLQNPKTGKKVTIRDTGKDLRAQRMQGAERDGKEDVVRGAASELQKEVDYLKEK